MYRGKSGKFKPANPSKYAGDVNAITYRSTYELKFFFWADKHPSVLKWNSEELVIPYYSKVDQKMRRYFTDNMVQIKKKDGSIETLVIEIKPYKFTQKPTPPKRKTAKTKQRYLNECLQYQVNQDKWDTARQFCEKNNMKFVIMTEYELGIKPR